MLERFWGAHGVYATDFSRLVHPDEGGIRTDDLARALEARGLDVTVRSGDPSVAEAALTHGLPVMLLIGSGAERRHYVVLISRSGNTARIHDPNWGPDRAVAWKALESAWAASHYWALVATGLRRTWTRTAARATRASHSAVHLPGGALSALRAGRYGEAKEMGRRLLRGRHPDPQSGWRLLATTRWLEGDARGALRAWNHVDEPRLDLLDIHGLEHVRFQALASLVPIAPGEVVTPGRLALTRRRARSFPALAAARTDYRPNVDGSADVQISVLERPRVPSEPWALASPALEALFRQGTHVSLGPFTGAAERWTIHGTWDPASSGWGLSLAVPAPVVEGIVTVRGDWRRERFRTTPTGVTEVEQRRRAELSVQEWLTPHVRVSGGAALERWSHRGTVASGLLGLVLSASSDRTWLRSTVERWAGRGRPFGRVKMQGRLGIASSESVRWWMRGGVTLVDGAAPKMLWPGAGSGRARTPLLRGHGLVEGGRIGGPVFGRRLAHATLERFRFWRFGPIRVGWTAFADLAGARESAAGGAAGPYLDIGGGLRVQMHRRSAEVALAHGAEGWRWSGTVRTGLPWTGRW